MYDDFEKISDENMLFLVQIDFLLSKLRGLEDVKVLLEFPLLLANQERREGEFLLAPIIDK